MKMRNWALFVAAVLVVSIVSVPAQAMVLKKTWILQGQASFSTASGDLYGDDSQTNIGLSPTVHYTIMDKFAVGGTLDFNSYSSGDVSNSSFGIGPSVRYYFGGEVEKRMGTFNPYLGGGIFLKSWSWDNGQNSDSQSGSTIQVLGGVAFFLSNTVAVTPELSINLDSRDGDSGTRIMLGIGITGFLHQK
jgi:hypothetical protein